MAKKTAENFTIKTAGRGGGYDSNKEGNYADSFKRCFLKEPRDEENDAILMTYKVDEGTEENELIILDDLDVTDPELVFQDTMLYDGLNVGNVSFNTLASDDDPRGKVFCPIADMLRANPHVRKVDYYVKFPQYGLVFTGIDRNEYEIKKGDRKGEFVADRKRLVFITQRYVENLIRDIVNACKKAGVKSLRGTVWHIARAMGDRDKGVFTPKIGDRWDLVKVLSEDELLDTLEDAAQDAQYDTVENFCAPINYATTLEPLPVEEREKIAEIILEHVGPAKEERRGGGGRSGGRSRSPRNAQTSRGSRQSSSSGGRGSRTTSVGGDEGKSRRTGGRASARKADYTKSEDKPEQAQEGKGEGYFPEDDDVPF